MVSNVNITNITRNMDETAIMEEEEPNKIGNGPITITPPYSTPEMRSIAIRDSPINMIMMPVITSTILNIIFRYWRRLIYFLFR